MHLWQSTLNAGLDLLAPGVGFTWGITTIFLQRGNERNVQDQFTAVDSARRVKLPALKMFDD